MKNLFLIVLYYCIGANCVYSQNQQNTMPVTGNVGIGTANPSCKLDVNGETHITGKIIITDTYES